MAAAGDGPPAAKRRLPSKAARVLVSVPAVIPPSTQSGLQTMQSVLVRAEGKQNPSGILPLPDAGKESNPARALAGGFILPSGDNREAATGGDPAVAALPSVVATVQARVDDGLARVVDGAKRWPGTAAASSEVQSRDAQMNTSPVAVATAAAEQARAGQIDVANQARVDDGLARVVDGGKRWPGKAAASSEVQSRDALMNTSPVAVATAAAEQARAGQIDAANQARAGRIAAANPAQRVPAMAADGGKVLDAFSTGSATAPKMIHDISGYDLAPNVHAVMPSNVHAAGSTVQPTVHAGVAMPQAGTNILPTPLQDTNGGKKTWSSLFSSPSTTDKFNLHYEAPTFCDGKLVINGSPEEIAEGEAHWKNSLVGYFIGSRPSFQVVKAKSEAMWKPSGSLEVLSLPSGFFIFRFSMAEDKQRVLEGGPWFVQNKLLILRSWDREMKLEKLNLSTIPLWVKIYNLPLYLWTPTFIGRIMSSLGKPLYMDHPTASKSRSGYARVCIEISASQDLPQNLQFSFNNNQDYSIQLEYDWKPLRCSYCSVFGHSTTKCSSVPPKPKAVWVPKGNTNATSSSVIEPSLSNEGAGCDTSNSGTSEDLMLPNVSELAANTAGVETSLCQKSAVNNVLASKDQISVTNPPNQDEATSSDVINAYGVKGKKVVSEASTVPHIALKNSFDCLLIDDVSTSIDRCHDVTMGIECQGGHNKSENVPGCPHKGNLQSSNV